MSISHPALVRRVRSHGSALLAVAVASSLLLAGCGGKDEKEATTESEASPTPTVLYSPLTGEQVEAEPKHPIVVVKIDNSEASSPQIGLSKADLVTEELVEGGITRLAVMFDQTIPDNVGPVRSMRATDIGIVTPAKAVLVASGGAPQTLARVREAQIKTFTEGAAGFYRDDSRHMPYNLFNHLNQVVKTIKHGERPDSYLPFDTEATSITGRPATALEARFSGSSVTRWKYDGSGYVNTNSNAAPDDQFEPSTVLVLRVRVGDAGYVDPIGNPVPETHFTGTGKAMVFNGGQLVRGTWSKSDYDAPLTLSTQAGELKLPPGKVWIELVPAGTGSVAVTH
ncbi:MAG: DUF3048 domain-containing protein [Nocardioidaceae bacterium]